MKTIQVVLYPELLRAANGAAKQVRINRSALVRDALRERLKRLRTRESEAGDPARLTRAVGGRGRRSGLGRGGLVAGTIARGEVGTL
jgi:hypothetical protein